MKKTGELLKKVREEKNISLSEASMVLKINLKNLKAIEDGDIEHLPQHAFLKGFIKSYAAFLHLNPNDVIALFNEELGVPVVAPQDQSHSLEEPKASMPAETRNTLSIEENLNSKTIILSVLAVVLVVAIVFINRVIEKYSKETIIPNTQELVAPHLDNASAPTPPAPAQPAPPAAPHTAATAPSSPSIEPKPPVPPPASPSAPTAPTPTPAIASPPKPPAPAVAPPAPAPTAPTPTPAIASPPKPPAPAVAPPAPAKPGKSIVLIVEAIEKVDVTYSTQKGTPEKITLSSGQVHTFKSTDGLKLSISNAGAVSLTYNGQDLGTPGAKGQSINLRY